MTNRSAGILLYRSRDGLVEVLLVHPGGPYWARRDLGAWSLPKGEIGVEEEAERAARREFEEELGTPAPAETAVPLGEAVQAGGKRVLAWAIAGDFDVTEIMSNEFELEWPPHSGRKARFPEVDRAEWFRLDLAAAKIIPGQKVLLERLEAALQAGDGAADV